MDLGLIEYVQNACHFTSLNGFSIAYIEREIAQLMGETKLNFQK